MFYCDPCARERELPVSMARSVGSCEICKKKRVCSDVKSSKLPSLEETEEMTHIDSLKHQLQLKSLAKQAEEKLSKKTTLLTNEECRNMVSCAEYSGRNLTDLDKIVAAYPNHELVIEADDGKVFTVWTEGGDLYTIKGRYVNLKAYAEEQGWQIGEIEDLENSKATITIPGVKNIYYMEM